jgi:hypothetical protein
LYDFISYNYSSRSYQERSRIPARLSHFNIQNASTLNLLLDAEYDAKSEYDAMSEAYWCDYSIPENIPSTLSTHV